MPETDWNANYRLTDYSDDVLIVLNEKLKKALTECGIQAEKYAKMKCPVDTGRLRNSITNAVVLPDLYIGTNVFYGKYVEYHTKHPQPFLKPAIANHIDVYKKIIKENLK